MRTVIAGSMLAAAAAFGTSAHAQQSGHGSQHVAGTPAQAGATAEGEVRKIDKAARRITLKHGPIANLDMAAMTMVFQVKDAAVLEKVKVGDKVKFRAENVGGQLTVTSIERAK